MTSIKEIEQAVEKLTKEELAAFRKKNYKTLRKPFILEML